MHSIFFWVKYRLKNMSTGVRYKFVVSNSVDFRKVQLDNEIPENCISTNIVEITFL